MKIFILIFYIFFAEAILAGEIIPGEELKSWGYETTEINEKWHSIKRVKGEKWGDSQFYYPRFTLSKTCFNSAKQAETRQQFVIGKQKNDPFKGFKSHYDSFVFGNCLFSISTAARVTYLSYQPEILRRYRAFIESTKAP